MTERLAILDTDAEERPWFCSIDRALVQNGIKIERRPCATLNDLRTFYPTIIVGHQLPWLVEFLVQDDHSLRWIHVNSSGVSTLLNGLPKSPSFRVSNSRGIHAQIMREYALTAMLYFEKSVERWQIQKEKREWVRPSVSELCDKRILIYGAGKIGRAVSQTCRHLGMSTLGVSTEAKPVEEFDQTFTLQTASRVLGDVDFVFVSMAPTRTNHRHFSRKFFGGLKTDAVFINVSGGGLVDESALLECLFRGRIKGAAIDAFDQEPLPPDSPFWKAPNLLLTPHIAGKSVRGRERAVELFVRNLSSFLKDGTLQSEVDIRRGY